MQLGMDFLQRLVVLVAIAAVCSADHDDDNEHGSNVAYRPGKLLILIANYDLFNLPRFGGYRFSVSQGTLECMHSLQWMQGHSHIA